MGTKRFLPYPAVLAGLLTAALWHGPGRAGEVEKKIEAPVHQAVRIERKTQAAESRWRDEKEKRATVFESLEAELAALEAEKTRQVTNNQALKNRIARKKQQIAAVARTSAQISPFLDQLLVRIRDFRDQDLPFLRAERQKRLQTIERLNTDPEVPVSEKFRKIMEALMVETEYGQTVEVYQQTVDLSGESTLVNIFRLGRLCLFYLTLDKQHCGFYNTAQKAWKPIDKTYLKTIQAAVDMGSKRKPAEILDLPLGRIAVQ